MSISDITKVCLFACQLFGRSPAYKFFSWRRVRSRKPKAIWAQISKNWYCDSCLLTHSQLLLFVTDGNHRLRSTLSWHCWVRAAEDCRRERIRKDFIGRSYFEISKAVGTCSRARARSRTENTRETETWRGSKEARGTASCTRKEDTWANWPVKGKSRCSFILRVVFLVVTESHVWQAQIQNIYITTGYGWDQSDVSVMWVAHRI